jgi:DMSO/TMAO reductase YedYZ molybdopterin-dependent catalytic subunit
MLHMALGVLLVPLVLVHLAGRYRPPRRADFEGRRTALTYLALGATGALAWRAQSAINRLLGTPGADRRFTGSRERGSFAGNAFPTTSWVADDPDPIDLGEWSLTVDGATARTLDLGYDDLAPVDRERSTLDCTSGWYSVQDWTGVRVGDLLDAVEPVEEASYVRFRSVTGYRWSLPIEEAREALLATHVGGEAISHGHGFPLRVVTPGRRGFQWVKWVESVEVRREYDYGQWVVIFTSGFSDRG